MLKTYQGSCHCGDVRFAAEIDFAAGSGKCNCTICAKNRFWGAIVKPPAFHLLTDASALGDYQFGSLTQHHTFCKRCGVHPFGRGFVDALGGEYYSVNVACLDGVDPAELAAMPVRYFDGLHNAWQSPPAVTSHL